MCLTIRWDKGMIHTKSVLFLHCTVWISLEVLAGHCARASLFAVVLCVAGWTGCEEGLPTHIDIAFYWFCPTLASSRATGKVYSEQTITHRVNERQPCGLARGVSVEDSWLGNVGKLPSLWTYAHSLHCVVLPVQISSSSGSGNL